MSGHCDVELAAKPPQRTQQLHVAVVGSDSGVDVSSVARLLKQLLVQRDAPRDKASPHVAFVHVTSVSPAGTPFPLHRTRDGRRLSLTVMEEARKHMKQVERAKAVRAGGPLEDEAAGLASSQASSQGDDEGSLARKRRGVASAGNRRHRSNQPGGKEGSGRKGAAAEEPPLTPAQLEERQKFIETYLPLCELVNVAVHSPGAMEQMPGAPSTIPVLFVYELAEQAHLMQQLEEGVEDIDFAGAFWRTIASTLPSELTELSVVWAVPDARMLRAFRQEDPSRRAAGAKTEPAEPEDRRRATSSSNPKSASSSPSISNVASTTNLTSLPCLPMATLDPNVQRNLVPRVVLYVNESGFDVNLGDPHHHPSFEQSTSKRPGGRGSNAGGAKKSARKGNTGDGSRSSSRGAKAGTKPQKGGATPSPHDTPMCYYDPQRELVEQRLYATSTTFAQFIEKQQLFVHQRQQLQQQQRLYLPGFVDQCGRNPLYQKLILTVEEENALVNFSPGLENITSASTYGGTNPFSFSNACGAVTLHDRMASARDGRSGLSSWLSDGATILESHLTTDMCEIPSLSDLAVYNAAVSAELLERRSNSPPTATADRRTSGGTIAEPPTRKAKLQIKHRRAVAEPVWATIMASQKDCLDEEWLSTCAATLVPALDQLVSITGSYHTWRQGHHLTVMPPTPAEEAWRRATGETGEGSAADAPLAGDAAAASAGAAGAAPIATTTSRSVSPTPSSPISPTNPATQPPVGTYQKGISPTDLRGARTMEDSVEVSPVNHTGLEIYDKQKRFNGEFTWTSAILALIAQATNHLAQQLPTMLVKPADPDIPLASLTVTLSQSAIARARSRSGPMEKSLSCLHMRSRCSSRVQSSDVGEPAQRLRLASRQPEDLVAGGADQSVYLGGADTATRLGDTMSAVRFRDIARREVEDGTRVCQRPPLLRSYLGDALLATGDNTGTTSVLHGAEWLRRRTAMVHAARAKRATAVDAVISAAVAAAATAAAPSPRPANTRKASLKRGKKVKEEPSMASIATEADSTQAGGAEIRYVVPCDHALDRPQLRPQPQEINWLVEQYVKQAGGYFAYTKRGGDTVASTVAPHRLNSVSAAEETMGTIHSTHGNPSQYFQAVHRMRELRGGVFNGAGMYEAEGHVRQMLHSTIDANLRVVNEATILAGLGMVSRSPHETLDSSLSSMVDASAYCPLLPIRLLQRCTVPLSSVELKLQCAVERSLTRREREHILQQTILLALARTAHLLPDPPGGDQRQPIPSLVEEVVTMVVMYNRLQQFLRRYGAHLCSLLSFQPGSSSNAATLPLPRSPAKKAAAAAMNSTSPPRNHTGSTKAPLRRTSVFSKSAENIFPPRRAEHFWVAGLEVPPMRRRRLLWLHPSAGVPSLSQFMGWRRLLEQLEQAEVEDCDRRTKLGEYLESPPPDATPDAIQTEVSAPFSLPIGDQPAFTTGMDASAAPVDPRAEQGLPASVVKGLLAKHLSQRNFYARPSQTPLPPFADYTHAEQLQLTAEGRQVMYPYCDAIVELVSTNYQRSCRYVKANELTATMHYNIPPFSASAEAAFLEAGGCLPLYEESIYAVMRFDDGVTFTITQNQSRRPPPPPVEPERSECASGRSPPSTPGIPQTPRSTGSRASVRRGSHSSVDRERVRKPARSSTVKGRRRTVKTESVVAVEQPTEVVLPLSSLVPPPIGPDGDVRLWTARLPLPPEKRAAMREVAAEAAQAQAAGTAILANSVTASCTRTSMSTSVGLTAAAAAAASAAAAGSAAPPVLVDPTIPNTKRQVHPLDITITTNNFVLHRKQEEHLLWCTSHSTEDSTMHYAGPTHYAFASLESIAGVHVYDGEKSAVVTSMERESTRSVDEASGIVTRYFESGSMQVLFPNGAVLVRYREPARTASLYRSAGHVDPRAPHGDLDPSSGMLGRGPRLLDPNAGNRFCETLTTPSGAQFVRCVTEEEKTGHHGDPWRHVRQPRRMSPFMRLTAVATVEVQRSYDAMHHCLMTSRQDGVSTVFYYRKGGSNGRMQATETMMSYTTDRAFVAMVEAGFAGTMDSMQGDGGLAAESLDRINAYACVVLHADGTTITTFADGTALSATLPLGGTTATSHGGVTRLLDSTGAGMDEDDDEQWRSPVIAPLIAVAKAVSGECSATTRWCVESPRMPRFFLTAPSFARRDLRPSEEPEETVAIGRANNNNTTTNEGEGFDPSARRERGEGTTCFYVIFGDGTVLKRHVIARKARGTSVPFLETVLARSTKTSIRVIHENGLAVIEPMDAVVRNSRNVACLAVGEGFPMLDFAQGGFRLVDYQCHVTEVKGLYSPFGATVTMAPSTWEAQLQQLVSDTYTPHRIPKARQEEREERQRRAELADRQARLRGVCPSLLHRLRELAEPFIVKNNLLSPELLHNLRREHQERKRMALADALQATSKTLTLASAGRSIRDEQQGTAGATSATGNLTSTISPEEREPCYDRDGIAPVLFSKLTNGEVLEYMDEAKLHYVLQQQANSEFTPLYLSRSTASGEPGVRQLTLFRAGPAVPAKESPNLPRGESGAGRSNSRAGSPGSNFSVSEDALVQQELHRQQLLSRFCCGQTPEAHYSHGELHKAFDAVIASPRTLCHSSSLWLPPSLQPPRRFLQPKLRASTASRAGADSRSAGRGGHILVLEDSATPLPSDGANYELMRVFLQFESVTPATMNIVLNSELQHHEQMEDLGRYHNVMTEVFPAAPTTNVEEQKRLQALYQRMRESAQNRSNGGSRSIISGSGGLGEIELIGLESPPELTPDTPSRRLAA